MSLEFRRMSESDISEIVLLENMIFGDDAWSPDSFAYEINNSKISFPFVLCNENKIIGYAVFWYYADELHIGNIAIRPEFQNQGHGKYILQKIFDLIGSYKSAFLEVRLSNDKAIGLYKKYKFKPFMIRKSYYRNGEDALIMMKDKTQGE